MSLFNPVGFPNLGGNIPPPAAANTSGMVFPVQGYSGPISTHWGSVLGGSDIMAPRGTPVLAMQGGRVISSGVDHVGGNSVFIQGNDGNQYYYAHLDSPSPVQAGQNIPAGTYLGPVGNTGDAAGGPTHLHIGIGPTIRLGADKYGGTGGDYDAVSLLKAAQAGLTATPNMYQTATRSNLPFTTGTALTGVNYNNQYASRAAQIAQQYNIPADVFVKLVKQESSFDPNARSGVGAQGLTQLMPATAAGLGVTNPFDPEQSLQGGAKFFSGLLKQFNGDVRLALAAYNAGPGAVQKYGGVPPFEETQRYVNTILGSDNPMVNTSGLPQQSSAVPTASKPAGGLFGLGSIFANDFVNPPSVGSLFPNPSNFLSMFGNYS